MTSEEPRRPLSATHAERSIVLGAMFAILGAIVGTASWVSGGASSAALSFTAMVPVGAFGAGVALRALGAVLTRFSSRTSRIVLGDVLAFLLLVAVAGLTGSLHDSEGATELAAIIALAFGLPVVSVVSLIAALTAPHTIGRRVLFSAALLLSIVAAMGYGASFWS